MSENRLPDYLEHMRQAPTDARSFVDGMKKEDFLADKRTQQAVIMSLVIIGEVATKVLDRYPDFADRHPTIPWRNIRGMRNRIAHGYFRSFVASSAQYPAYRRDPKPARASKR